MDNNFSFCGSYGTYIYTPDNGSILILRQDVNIIAIVLQRLNIMWKLVNFCDKWVVYNPSVRILHLHFNSLKSDLRPMCKLKYRPTLWLCGGQIVNIHRFIFLQCADGAVIKGKINLVIQWCVSRIRLNPRSNIN